MCLEIIARESWLAENPRSSHFDSELTHPVLNVVFTYTNTLPCETGLACRTAVYNLQHRAIRLKFQEDIYYNFLIGGDGKLYEGRGWWTRPSLPFRHRFHNKDSIYVAFIGRFYDKRPPDIMRKVRFELIQYGLTMKFIADNYEKRDIANELDTSRDSNFSQGSYQNRY